MVYDERDQFVNKSFSVSGEDLMISGFFSHDKRNGTYLDIGSNHPVRFSNTYHFYLRGWRGLCIDPLPSLKRLYLNYRPEDIFINKGIDISSHDLDYYQFDESAYNTFDQGVALSNTSSRLINTQKVLVEPLSSILGSVHPNGMEFDFCTIDVEGFELRILKSNDWDRFKVSYILVEIHQDEIGSALVKESAQFLVNIGYVAVAKNRNNVLFKFAP